MSGQIGQSRVMLCDCFIIACIVRPGPIDHASARAPPHPHNSTSLRLYRNIYIYRPLFPLTASNHPGHSTVRVRIFSVPMAHSHSHSHPHSHSHSHPPSARTSLLQPSAHDAFFLHKLPRASWAYPFYVSALPGVDLELPQLEI